jgi:hypothetical protein
VESAAGARLTVATAWPFCSVQVVFEIGRIPGRHPASLERLLVGAGELTGKLAHVLNDGMPGFRGQIVVAEELVEKGCLVLCDSGCRQKHYRPNSSRLIDCCATNAAPATSAMAGHCL